jgi:NADH-quinone oxidoreductase subunit L
VSHTSFVLLDWIILAPLLGALFNGLFGEWLPRKVVHWVACIAMGSAFFFTLLSLKALAGIDVHGQAVPVLFHRMYEWFSVGDLTLNVAFYFDPLTAVMCLVITGVGTLIHIYSIGYMEGDRSYARYFTYLNFFCFAMLILVLGDSLVLLFVGWEGVGLASYLLIGFWYRDVNKALAGKKAFIVNRIGDVAVLLGMFVLFGFTKTLDIPGIKAAVLNMDAATAAAFAPFAILAAVLFFIGCTGKSAQLPLQVWLPDAMAGPTPVSALIHAATMVTAGVYLVTRMGFLYDLAAPAMMMVAVVGCLTALIAALIGICQNDIKKVLAYSTISQLGYMFVAVGVGAYTAAIFHLVTHAFFKALLFLGAGAVIHSLHGEQDIRQMGGLGKRLPIIRGTFLIACLAISGIPLFSGFFSKDEILWGAFSGTVGPAWLQIGIWAVATVTAGITAFYMFRLYFLTFGGSYRGDEEVLAKLHRPGMSISVPLVTLAVLAAFGGFLGVPEALVGGMSFLHDWLHPVVGGQGVRIAHDAAHGIEVGLMVLSVCVAAAGIGLAWFMYVKRTDLPGQVAEKVRPVYRVILNKFYLDEIYDRAIVQPLKTGSRVLYEVVDRILIDTIMVAGVAFIAESLGKVNGMMQNGNVQRYAFFVVLGLSLTLLFVSM